MADEIASIGGVMPPRSEVGRDISGVGGHRHGRGEGRRLPPAGGLVPKGGTRQATAGGRPERTGVRPRVSRSLVELDAGDMTGHCRYETHTDLSRTAVARGVGLRHGRATP